MNKLIAIFILFVLFFMAGCFGDPITQSVVVLDLPNSQRQTNINLSASRPQIQKAMRIIDQAFATNGFARDDVVTPEDRAQGIIASYGRYDVLVSSNELVVNFVEFGKRRPSPIVNRTCNLLKEQLAKEFGAQAVHTEVNGAKMDAR